MIKVEGLGKRYELGVAQAAYSTLRESLTESLRAPLRAVLRGRGRREPETVWALRDVGFEVARGEVLALVGGNGAGKSTLLKILSRITEPTEGRAELFGRVGSLLEVGTGFHPELSGRENIQLSGAILGMSREEIQAEVRRDSRVRRDRASSSTRPSSATRRGCTCASRSPSPRISSRRYYSWTRCSPSATQPSRRSVWAR